MQTGASVTEFFQALGRPVAYFPIFATKLGGVTPAVMFCQLSHWYRIEAIREWDGWIYKTTQEMYEETGLTRWEQETARKRLSQRGVIETQVKGIPPKMHYRIKWETFESLWGNPANQFVGNPQINEMESTKSSIQRLQHETTTENLPVATLPAVKKAKHSPEQVAQFKALADIFYSRSGKWQHGVKEATALYKLLDYGRDRPEYPALLVEAFWKLHKGELYGMTESEKRWWASIPYVPSRLDAKAVETMMERVEDSNRVSPEYLAQLEKDFPSRKRISK